MGDQAFDRLGLALPPFLSAEGKRELIAQLRRYPDNFEYFGWAPSDPEAIQGDGWSGLTLFDFETAEREKVQGLILSNSCDIAAANAPMLDQRVAFAPILELSRYQEFIVEAGKTPRQADEYVAQIRRQEIHRLFYLPSIHGLFEESIVALDNIHSIPLEEFSRSSVHRVFSLSMYGWYVLLVKLSIHFTRMAENVDRRSAAQAG